MTTTTTKTAKKNKNGQVKKHDDFCMPVKYLLQHVHPRRCCYCGCCSRSSSSFSMMKFSTFPSVFLSPVCAAILLLVSLRLRFAFRCHSLFCHFCSHFSCKWNELVCIFRNLFELDWRIHTRTRAHYTRTHEIDACAFFSRFNLFYMLLLFCFFQAKPSQTKMNNR